MKQIFILIIPVFFFISTITAQGGRIKLDETSIVKDSTGQQFPYAIWSALLGSADFDVKLVSPPGKTPEFLIFPLSEAEKMRRITSAPKPEPSKFFTTGKPFGGLKTKDINGNKIDLKEMKGKIVVLNYWFINCPPCRHEIPHLNKIVNDYAGDSSIVFIAIALDGKDELEAFFKLTAFDYTQIDNGRSLARDYGVSGFPTNVVINKEGKVAFHTSGYGIATPFWIKKSIEELKHAGQ